MKYCSNCGSEIEDSAAYCSKCGAPCASVKKPSTLKLIAEIFMVIGCVELGFLLLPLCWTVPMTVKYFRCVKENKPVSTSFMVCSLLFVSLIAGILMLVDNEIND